MEKFPFKNEGATELVAALYALPDAALHVEADEAHANFADWLLKHFTFEPSQVAYLGSMSTSLLDFMGAQVAMAMRHRLSLTLVKPEYKGLRDSKLIETKSNIDADGDGSGGENATGSVRIEISY